MSEGAERDASDVEHALLIDSFMQITGSDSESARVSLEWSMWNLGLALEHHYGNMDLGTLAEGPIDDSGSRDARLLSAAEQEFLKPKEGKTRFGTIAGLKSGDATDDSDDDEGQAYYAGGSEHSGQQVLGPPSRKKKKDFIADILKSVQKIGAEVVDTSRPSTSNLRESFSGMGYRLGQTETDTPLQGSASNPRPNEDTRIVTLKLWKEGFNLNDGSLRDYDDPENKQFLDSVRKGLIPTELTSGAGDTVVQLNLEDHHHKSFDGVRTSKVKPFSGQGYVLGRPTPPVVRNTSEELPQGEVPADRPFEVDHSQETTTISIRLPDGSRLNGVFNHTHTVGDIRTYINRTRPEYATQSYTLQTTIPMTVLNDNSATVTNAKLLNTVLIMRILK